MRARRLRWTVVGPVLALLTLVGCGSGSDPAAHSASRFSPEGRAAAQHFLDRYVATDGRVLRHDQGDDVVSEGQAYGMVIAELVGADDTVRRIWSWTRSHLRRPDGLLSFHADADGQVIDPESATDADTLAAYALLRYDGAGEAELHRDGNNLADAVLDTETVPVGSGGLVPSAGSWVHGEPYAVNPSYWMPGVAAGLAELTGDDRWDTVRDTTARLLGDLTGDGTQLPPDWAQVARGRTRPTGAPDGSRPAQYGPDAQRVPLFSAACTDTAELAAAWWQRLAPDSRAQAQSLALDGSVTEQAPAPLALLASAAAARAAGEDDRAAQLVGSATDLTGRAPTYYGDAWLALAAGLAEQRFGTC